MNVSLLKIIFSLFSAQDTEVRNQNVPGDALLLAATVSYLGPFGPDTRTELLRKWQTLCQTGSIDINPNDPRISLFTQLDTVPGSLSLGFPIPVTERLQLPLGQALGMNEWQTEDTLSARLMVKLLLCGYRSTYIQHWPLLVDSQQHLEMNFPNSLILGMCVCAYIFKMINYTCSIYLDQPQHETIKTNYYFVGSPLSVKTGLIHVGMNTTKPLKLCCAIIR